MKLEQKLSGSASARREPEVVFTHDRRSSMEKIDTLIEADYKSRLIQFQQQVCHLDYKIQEFEKINSNLEKDI